jgi:hypothetical protein
MRDRTQNRGSPLPVPRRSSQQRMELGRNAATEGVSFAESLLKEIEAR